MWAGLRPAPTEKLGAFVLVTVSNQLAIPHQPGESLCSPRAGRPSVASQNSVDAFHPSPQPLSHKGRGAFRTFLNSFHPSTLVGEGTGMRGKTDVHVILWCYPSLANPHKLK
jgi:hypothetical protein